MIFNAIFDVLIVGVLINSKDIFDVLISMFWSTKKTISTFWNFWPVDVLIVNVLTPSLKSQVLGIPKVYHSNELTSQQILFSNKRRFRFVFSLFCFVLFCFFVSYQYFLVWTKLSWRTTDWWMRIHDWMQQVLQRKIQCTSLSHKKNII